MLRPRTLLITVFLTPAAALGWLSDTNVAIAEAIVEAQSGGSIKKADAELSRHVSVTNNSPPRDSKCDADWACVEPVQTGSRISFFAENRKPVPITLTLRVDAEHVRGADRRVITATLEGDSRENFVTFTATQAGTTIDYRYRFEWTVGRHDARHDDRYVYRLPYAGGSSYRVLQTYGSRFSHTGYERYAVDFNMREGTPVFAARGGIVARLEESHDKGCWADGCSRYANFVVILHDDGTTSEYYHLQKNGVLVDEGDHVEAGQEIARSGNTGHTTMPHLHFAVYRAASWGNTQSIPVRFQTAEGIIARPRRGGAYVAP